jgi:hypothetical protein
VTGFLARATVQGGLGAFGGCAIAGFAVCALACVWVLLPRWEQWEFSINAKSLMPYFLNDAKPEPSDSLFKYLAEKIQDDFEHNADCMGSLYGWFTWACVALATEVILWCLALALD